MKVKQLQEKIKNWNPNDDIVFCEYDYLKPEKNTATSIGRSSSTWYKIRSVII